MIDNKINISVAENGEAMDIHGLMKKVYDSLEDKSLFFCDDLNYVRERMEDKGFAIKAEYAGKIVGSLIVNFPGMDEDNLGRDISLPVQEYKKVAHIESTVVDEKYRGYGLQDKMMNYAEEIIVAKGYVHLMATVSPDNTYSLRNFQKNGYKIMKVKEKYGGLMRAVLYKQQKSSL